MMVGYTIFASSAEHEEHSHKRKNAGSMRERRRATALLRDELEGLVEKAWALRRAMK